MSPPRASDDLVVTSPLKGLTGPYPSMAARQAAVARRHTEACGASHTALKALDAKVQQLHERLLRSDWTEGESLDEDVLVPHAG